MESCCLSLHKEIFPLLEATGELPLFRRTIGTEGLPLASVSSRETRRWGRFGGLSTLRSSSGRVPSTVFLKALGLLQSVSDQEALRAGHVRSPGETLDMKMVIPAAGLGTRLGQASNGRPKVLLDLGGETILDRLLSLASDLRLDPLVVTRPEHV